VADDHLKARGFWVSAPHPAAGELAYTGPPWRVDGGGWALRSTAPTLGRDTNAVLAGVLGLDAARIGALRDRRVVA
jgi:crotonobetainyl-CoA:carnitine CoA-transferase CaiB-like acyl-CoA transferase